MSQSHNGCCTALKTNLGNHTPGEGCILQRQHGEKKAQATEQQLPDDAVLIKSENKAALLCVTDVRS